MGKQKAESRNGLRDREQRTDEGGQGHGTTRRPENGDGHPPALRSVRCKSPGSGLATAEKQKPMKDLEEYAAAEGEAYILASFRSKARLTP
jgi:hypothetical protein